jgi:hypothetical protein
MAVGQEMQVMALLTEATKKNAVASIVSALITAANRPHSVGEVQELMRSVEFSLYSAPGNGAYEQWERTFKPNEPHK